RNDNPSELGHCEGDESTLVGGDNSYREKRVCTRVVRGLYRPNKLVRVRLPARSVQRKRLVVFKSPTDRVGRIVGLDHLSLKKYRDIETGLRLRSFVNDRHGNIDSRAGQNIVLGRSTHRTDRESVERLFHD